MGEAERRVAAVARRQHGLITKAQATEMGMSKSAWYRALDRGRFEALYTNVARTAGTPHGVEQAILASVLACGPGMLASHTAAAHLWGVELRRWTLEVTAPHRDRRPNPPGVVVHRPRDLVDLRLTRRAGIPVTSPIRLLVDLGGAVSEAELEHAIDQLVVAGTVSVSAVRAGLVRHARPGRTGIGPLRAVLDRWALADERPDSEAEAAMARLLSSAGLPDPVCHHRIGRYEVDFAWPDLRVALEVDGWRVHGRRDAFEADRRRDLHLQSLGWRLLHVSAAAA